MAPHDTTSQPLHDPYAVVRGRDFRFFLVGHFLWAMGLQVQAVAVGWDIYERTGQAMSLAWVGLVQFLPVLVLTIPAGQLADRFDRRRLVMLAVALMAAASLGLAWVSRQKGEIWIMYALLALSGAGRALQQPAKSSLMPQIVPPEMFSRAVAWHAGVFQTALSLGPMAGGLLYASFGRAAPVYVIDAVCSLAWLLLLTLIAVPPAAHAKQAVDLRSLAAGVAFVWRTKLILSAITLDMFAVLLGGMMTLLPMFAKNILHVGPTGLGTLRAASGLGAVAMSVVLAHRPPFKAAGPTLLWSVAGFGLATIVAGLSRNFWLTAVMLFATGLLDSISVVIRHTLVQVLTPNEMRGRVSAINGLFIGASNELGGFESGLVAELFNEVVSAVSGGIGTLLVVAAVAWKWPSIRRYGRLGSGAPDDTAEHLSKQ